MVPCLQIYLNIKKKSFAAFHANEEEWIQESGRLYHVLYESGLRKTEAVCALKEAGEYDTGITPEPEYFILFLVTCSYREPGNRFVVAGALKDETYD